MKTTILLLIVFFSHCVLFAQNQYSGYTVRMDSCSNCLESNYQFHSEIDMETLNIISDMGPRQIGGFNWHGGIDYTNLNVDDQGFHVKSLEEGYLRRIRGNAGQKYPEIVGSDAHLMYNHMFTSANISSTNGLRQADVELVVLDSYSGTNYYRYGVLHYDADTTLIAACFNRNCSNSYKIVNQDTIYATDTVYANQIIGSIGISAGSTISGSVGSHLHLQRFKGTTIPSGCSHMYCKKNLIDPLEVVTHQGPRYDILVLKKEGSDSYVYPKGVNINYPGSDASKFLVRPMMPDSILQNGQLVPNNGDGDNVVYYNNTMNIDRVSILIKPLGVGDFTLIKGNHFESKIHLGLTENFHEHYPNVPGNNVIQNEGNWNRQGISHLAYGSRVINGISRRGRWDDYYFTDFITRIHRDDSTNGGSNVLANCPKNSRYNDGSYVMKARVTDVRGGYFEGPRNNAGTLTPIRFNLDNFKPFIQSVNVYIGTTEVYDMQWICESSCDGIRPEGGIIASEIEPFDFLLPMLVTVKCSEPMFSLDMQLSVYGDAVEESSISYETSADRQTWTFSVQLPLSTIGEPIPVSTGNDFSFSFTGLDYPVNVGDYSNANPLLNLETYYHPDSTQANTDCLQIPHRMDNQNTWSSTLPEGQELAHHFGLNCLSDDNIAGDGSEKSQIKLFNGFCCTDEFLAELSNSSTLQLTIPCLCQSDTLSPFALNVDTLLGPFTYKWSGPSEYESHQQTPEDITIAGDYSVSITNEDGCRVVQQINIPACIPILEPGISADTICREGDLSTIHINIANAEGLHFLWSNGSTGQNLEDVSAGTYSVTINSETVCELILETEVVVGYDSLAVISLTNLTDCICNLETLIQAFELSISGQDSPFTFQWSGPNGFTSTEQSPLINEAGDYTVTVTNAVGCEQLESINIPVCSGLSATVITSPSCSSFASGEATVHPNSDYPPFTFEWSNGETSGNAINLAEGIHSVTITDSKNCSIVETVEIGTHPVISILNPSVITDCSGEGQASITPVVTSGTAPFTYLWSDGQTTATATHLTSGDYNLTITDGFGCSQSFHFMLTVGERPMVSTTITNAHCKNNDGRILLDIQPAGSYTIQWSDGLMADQPFRDDLIAGNYVVVIGNTQGCFATEYFTINSVETPSELWDGVTIGVVTDASTSSYCNGSIEVLLGGSVGPYNVYLQSNTGSTINSYENVTDAILFEDLCVTAENAPYKVLIEDANGCSITKNVVIDLCSLTITVETFIRPHTTFDTDGSITVGIAEDYENVEYSWSNGEIGSTISGLSPGTYTVMAREKNGCEGTRTFVFDECYTLREVLDEEGVVLYEAEVPNYDDFEVITSGGLFLPGQDETPIVAFLREEGSTSFTAEFPSEYSITWRSINQSIIGENINPIIIPSNYGSGFSPRWIELTVSNSCISKTIKQVVFDCGTENDEEAAAFFIVNEVQPCIGSNNGEISLAIPNLFNSSIEILYGTEQVPIEIQSDGIVGTIAIVSGLSAGNHQFIITIDGCENTFVYSLEEAPVDEERLDYNPITNTCTYQQFCEGNLLAQRNEEPWLDPMNGTKNPCLVPVMCGNEKVWDKPYDKRRCRGLEYNRILGRLAVFGIPPFNETYLNFAVSPVGECEWVKYCTGNMKTIGTWGIGGGNAIPNGLSGNNCLKFKCQNSPNFRICPNEDCNTTPIYTSDTNDAPTENDCTRYESFNLYGLIYAYEQGWLNDAPNFSGSELETVLEGLLALPIEQRLATKCAKAIFCADNYDFFYHDVLENISCEAVLIPITSEAPNTWIEGIPISIPDHEVEAITTCHIISTITDTDTGYPIQEVIRCGKPDCAQFNGDLSFSSDCTTTQIVNYQELFDIFGVQPFAANPVQRLSRFDDPFLIEKIVRLNTLNFQDFAIPKLILATPQGRVFYDYIPREGVQKKTLVEGLAYQIDDWDTGQSLIALTNQSGGYRLIYEDSLHYWDQLVYSPQDTNFSIKNISITENTDEVLISGLVNGDLYVHQLLVAAFDSPSFFTLKLSLDGDVLEFIAARNIGKDDVQESSFSQKGDFVFIGEASMEGGIVQIGNDLIQPSADGKDQLIAFYNSTNGNFDLKTKIRYSENAKILKSAVGKSGEFGLLINNSDSLSFSNEQVAIHEFIGKSVLTSFSNVGQLQWQETIEGSDFLASDLLYLPDSTIFLALTFQNEINIGNHFFQSAGGSDIALIQFSKEGEIMLSQTYGTVENETVEKLFFNGELMFFAGEFWGNIQEREIGEQHFIDYTPYNNEVYISYINLEKNQDEIISFKNKLSLSTSPHFLKAYPNPFKNTFNLELNASFEDHITIEVVDLLGRLVFQKQGQVAKGFNQFEIKMKNVSSAQMLNVLVRFKSGKQPTMQTRLIRE